MSVRKSPKIRRLVVNAIRKLQDVQGSTPREISNYISQEYDVPSTKIQRQVGLALARAVSYGILQRTKGGYYSCNRDYLGCQQRMEEAQLTEKCAPRGRGRMRRARSRKSKRRKGKSAGCGVGGGGGRRGRGRAAGRRSRRRSRRSRGKSGGARRCGTSGGGRKSRRRRGRAAKGKRSQRRGRRRRGGRGPKKCSTGGDDETGSRDDLNVFGDRGSRRVPRRASATTIRNCSGSSLSGSFDEERVDEKILDGKPLDSPESMLD